MTRLAVIRHGATAWTETKRLQGRTDTRLSPAGAAAVRAWHLPAEVAAFDWYSSPLRRCRETAALLRGQDPGIDDPAIEVEPCLIEMSFGRWEGRTLAELRATYGPAMAREEARGLDFRPPEGESPRDVQARLRPWLAVRGAARRDSIAVTHRGVIRALYALATGWSMVGRPPVRLSDPALHLFALSPTGELTVQALNRGVGAAAATAP